MVWRSVWARNPPLSKRKWRNPAFLTSVQGRGLKLEYHSDVSVLSQGIGSSLTLSKRERKSPWRKPASASSLLSPECQLILLDGDLAVGSACPGSAVSTYPSLAGSQGPPRHFLPNHGARGQNQVIFQSLGGPCWHVKTGLQLGQSCTIPATTQIFCRWK